MSGWRHESLGSCIDRSKPLRFRFDGQDFDGFEGDTLASALLAAGVQVLGRSFKYHRPRGQWGMGAEEPNAIFDVTENGLTTPNQRATTTKLRAGMELRSVNTSPDAESDTYKLLDRLHRFIPAGFYYKTFMRLGWMRWEPRIRQMAGLGRVHRENRPRGNVPQVNASCDLLVIGAGPAGLAAARAAAENGRVVWLMDDGREPGGSLIWRGGEIGGKDWQRFVALAVDAVHSAGGRVFANTTVWGAFDHGMFAAWERRDGMPDVHWRIRARNTILAAGAIERPMWFANNDLPGVMSAEAALAKAVCFGAIPGRRIVIATANDLTGKLAQVLAEAGAEVTLVDQRTGAPAVAGVAQINGARVLAAEGRNAVQSVRIDDRDLPADTILVSGGYTPSVHLWCQAGGKLDWDAARDALVPRPGTAPMQVVGAANGSFSLARSVAAGWRAGGGAGDGPVVKGPSGVAMQAVRPDPSLPGRQWIDLQNDVTLKDVGVAAREGFTSVEHLKRYTTLGMATDQGRTSNFAGLAAMAEVTERGIQETGTTTYRPPFQPIPFIVLGGRQRGELFHPPRRLPLEDGHRSVGARFREYGGWLRPSVYGAGFEPDVAQKEARLARMTVAAYDASSLGKIEVIGPVAAELLDFVGYRRMSTLKPGQARYGFMLSENGIVYDDGVVLRLSQNRFIVSASSSHTQGVRFRLEDARQDRFGASNVFIHDVTSAWVTLTVTGPRARTVLEEAEIFVPDLAHMEVAEISFEGVPLRVARVSFTGDLSFELSVPSALGPVLRARVDAALRACQGTWLGLEALMILRAEKGFILIGKDTDGLTMPQDLGWAGPRKARKDEYIGKRSLFTPQAMSENRRELVGLAVSDGTPALDTGAHLIPQRGTRRSLGFVTSSYDSPNLGRPVALALLEDGHALMGQRVDCFNNGQLRPATVVSPCAFDPEGERLNG